MPMDAQLGLPQDAPAHKRKARRKLPGSLWLLLILLGVLIGIICVWRFGFQLTTIRLIGTSTCSNDEIIAISHLKYGQNLLEVDEDSIRANFRRSMVSLQGIQKEYPHTLYLKIKDRKPIAALMSGQNYYILDEEGIVLSTTDEPKENMPIFEGVVGISNLVVGLEVTFSGSRLRTAVFSLITELNEQAFTGKVASINVLDVDDITMELRDEANNIHVRLGDEENMRAKIGSVRSTLPFALQFGISGTLDVRVPEHPYFLPNQ